MSKSTRNTAFRKVDVDQYSEEVYEEDQVADDGVTGPSDAEVQSLLSKNRNTEALTYVLSTPPLATKNQGVKDKALQSVLKVLMSFKAAEIEGALKGLDQNKLDILMKYIYRGFEQPSENSSAQLLVWHDKVFAITGLGSIVRVLTDKKRV
jgi:actin related protein 2/3 complex subunit 5